MDAAARPEHRRVGDVLARPAPRVGLVLGGGGLTGIAFHAGVLHALQAATGWDPRDASLLVGTSAGALVAGLLRSGASAGELRSWCLDEELTAPWDDVRSRVDASWDELERGARRWRPQPPPRIVRQALAARTPRAVLAALLPASSTDHRPLADAFAARADGWPAATTWICAAHHPSGRRAVFGRDLDAGLAEALAASSAVPGLFRPVTIDGRRYSDGGAASMTSADLTAGQPLDAVIVSAPLSQRGRSPSALHTVLRWPVRRQLAAELAAVRQLGTPVLAIEPDAAAASALGLNPLAEDNLAAIVAAASRGAHDQLGASAPGSARVQASSGRTSTTVPPRST